jgi:hypothetical protein
LLLNLLEETKVDVATITEVEWPAEAAEFRVPGYVTFSPGGGGKKRV